VPLNPVGPGPNLQLLAREVSRRNGELLLATPSSSGSQTQLIATGLNQFLPQTISQFYAHVYGTSTGAGAVDAANRGTEVDASSWATATSTVTLAAPGMPATMAAGTYEIRKMNSRERVVEALNDAIGQLGFSCLREFKDESLVGVQTQWRYTLPSSADWVKVNRVEIQTNLVYADFPYMPAEAMGLRWRPERTVDLSGNELWQIQFSSQPLVGYIIRAWGEGFYPDLVNETDILAIAGRWQRIVLGWVYRWAQAMLFEWTWAAFPTGDGKRAHERNVDLLQKAKADILEQMKEDVPGKIVTPMSQMRGPSWNDPSYLGAFTSGGIRSSPYNPVG
jgi:hypothetical protein